MRTSRRSGVFSRAARSRKEGCGREGGAAPGNASTRAAITGAEAAPRGAPDARRRASAGRVGVGGDRDIGQAAIVGVGSVLIGGGFVFNVILQGVSPGAFFNGATALEPLKRIHPDGLFDPARYFSMLQDLAATAVTELELYFEQRLKHCDEAPASLQETGDLSALIRELAAWKEEATLGSPIQSAPPRCARRRPRTRRWRRRS